MLKYILAIEFVDYADLGKGATGVRPTWTTAQKARSEYARPTNKYFAAN
jgi:hypothetical protein